MCLEVQQPQRTPRNSSLELYLNANHVVKQMVLGDKKIIITHVLDHIVTWVGIRSLMILFLPEFTTMAGRRLRDAVKTVLTSGGSGEFDNNVHIVISGLTNTYSQYVTTFEEYQEQRYEVCVTIFIP